MDGLSNIRVNQNQIAGQGSALTRLRAAKNAIKRVNIADPYYGRKEGHIKHKGRCEIGGNAWINSSIVLEI